MPFPRGYNPLYGFWIPAVDGSESLMRDVVSGRLVPAEGAVWYDVRSNDDNPPLSARGMGPTVPE